MKKIIAILLTALLALSVLGCTAAPAAPAATQAPTATQAPAAATADASAETANDVSKAFSIGVVQIVEHAALDAAREGFKQALSDKGVTAVFDEQNAQGDQSTLATIGNQFVSENVDLILAIATPSAQSMAGITTEIPILATAVTDFEVASLVESNEVPGGNLSGTSDMNPIADQIALLFELFPDTATVGCIYNSGEDNSILQAGMAKAEVEKLGKAFTEITVTSTNDVQQAMQTLVGKCDAVYIPTDNTVASAMAIVSQVANDAKVPVICGESGMVDGGGLATLGINYFDLGYQTGLMAIRVLVDGEDISKMPVEFATGFDSAFNQATADAIGFTIPEKYASAVIGG